MPSFVRTQSIAVTWTTDTCQAVRLQVSGNACQVEKCWQGILGKDGASLAELLLHAVKAVDGDDGIYIVAGGNGQGWGMADLNMPALKPEEMRAALSFELRKQTPLSSDRLRWGYRLLPKKVGETTQPVRLYYVRNEHWNSWLKAIDGLHHVDALLPAPVALDPALEEGSLVIQGGHGIPGSYEYSRTESGRQIAPKEDDTALRIAEALPPSACKIGPIADQPQELQASFAAAIALGIYGLTNCVNTDQQTRIPLPDRFQARRHIAAKITAGVLGVFLLGLMVYSLAGNLSGHAAQIRQIDLQIKKTKAELAELKKQIDPKDNEKTEVIKNELIANIPNRPDFPSVLLAVTKSVPTTHWISDAFEWRDGQVSFKVQGPTKDLELTTRLEDTKFLGDVTERLSSMNNGAYTQRFEATARFDTDIEADLLRSREEVQKQREKERLEREKAAQKAVAEAEAAAEAELEEEEETEEAPAPEASQEE